MTHFRRLLLIVTALMLGATPVAAQLDDDLLREIEADMQEIRGLELREPIEVSTISAEDYMAETVDSLDTDYPPIDRERDTRVLIAFGLLDPDQDLGEAYSDLLGGSVAGYYDPYSGQMVIVTQSDQEEMGAFDQVTYAHETVHALQDQEFDLAALLTSEAEMTTDQSLAMRALVEGDATVAELDYLLSDMGLARDYLAEVEAMGLDEDMYADVPPFLLGTLMFPYEKGYEFVQVLFDEGGWELVNTAYANLPVSSEQVLHPEKYLAGELPVEISVPDISGQLGSEWAEIDQDTLGEYVISIMLAGGSFSDEQVELASNGWGGDAYSVVATDDDLAIVWDTAWDSEQDATEFARALVISEAERFEGDVTTEGSITTIQGDGVVAQITQDGSSVSYIQASSADAVAAIGAAAEAPASTPAATPVSTPVATSLVGIAWREEDAA